MNIDYKHERFASRPLVIRGPYRLSFSQTDRYDATEGDGLGWPQSQKLYLVAKPKGNEFESYGDYSQLGNILRIAAEFLTGESV